MTLAVEVANSKLVDVTDVEVCIKESVDDSSQLGNSMASLDNFETTMRQCGEPLPCGQPGYFYFHSLYITN